MIKKINAYWVPDPLGIFVPTTNHVMLSVALHHMVQGEAEHLNF
jgi:hypothetical protein